MRVSNRLAVSLAALTAAAVALAPAASAVPLPASTHVHRVVSVIDGDTVRLANGVKVRLIGFDTTEQGKCGSGRATQMLKDTVLGKRVTVTNPASVNDTDKYGRALRSISIDGHDVGVKLIKAGLANARYDSLNGYQKHPLQTTYRSLDKQVAHKCGSAVDRVGEGGTSSGSSTTTATSGSEPWNQPGPDLDCGDIRKKVRITGTDYHRLDADGDGWGCDSWG